MLQQRLTFACLFMLLCLAPIALFNLTSTLETPPHAIWSSTAKQPNAWFGASLQSAGDVNGDGFADVVVGAPTFDTQALDAGRVVVYYGSATGLAPSPDWAVNGDHAAAWLGYPVRSAGDVNGDGFDDLIVSAPFYNDIGHVAVYYGSAAGLSLTPGWSADGEQTNAFFGWSIDGAGDLNGDGFDDVIIGAYGHSGALPGAGRVYVYFGSHTGLSSTAHWILDGDQAQAQFGRQVAGAGDINGDTFADFAVAASDYSNGQIHEGRVFLYLGAATDTIPTLAWMSESNQPNAGMGRALDGVGDLNHDGYADLGVGVPFYDTTAVDAGRVEVYYGATTGLSAAPNVIIEGDQAAAELGRTLSSAGDLNGDGFDDMIIGAYRYDTDQIDAGHVYGYYGSANGITTQAQWTLEDHQNGANFGNGVGTAGDVDGDGRSEVLIGAYRYDNDFVDEGQATLFTIGTDMGTTTPITITPIAATATIPIEPHRFRLFMALVQR